MSWFNRSGQTARVERTENLRVWQDCQTVTLGNIPTELIDSSVNATAEPFYRAVTP